MGENLLGTLIVAFAAIIGSFLASWTALRKERQAFSRDKVISAASQYLLACDRLFKMAITQPDNEPATGKISQQQAKYDDAFLSAKEAADGDLVNMELLCPQADEQSIALLEASSRITDRDFHEEVDDDIGSYSTVNDDIKERYKKAQEDFIKQIRKLADF